MYSMIENLYNKTSCAQFQFRDSTIDKKILMAPLIPPAICAHYSRSIKLLQLFNLYIDLFEHVKFGA